MSHFAPIEINDDDEPVSTPAKFHLTYRLNYLPKQLADSNRSSVSIRDLITDQAKSAILTTYKVDVGWLLKTCPVLEHIPVMVVHSDDQTQIEVSRIPNKMHIKRPYLPLPYGTCHGKIMLIKYPSFLRLVVSTANLLSIDYENKTQGIWTQDFPLKINSENMENSPASTDTSSLSPVASDFKETLFDYIKRLELDASFLHNYDFKDVKVVLITSVPGYHSGKSLNKYGHLKVKCWLEKYAKIGNNDENQKSIFSQVSSLGSLTSSWLDSEFGKSFSAGNLTVDNTTGTQSKTKKQKLSSEPTTVQLVWPTLDFVRNTIDGYAAGASLCFSQKNLKPFMKERSSFFRLYVPTFSRSRISPHIKTYTRILTTAVTPTTITTTTTTTATPKISTTKTTDTKPTDKKTTATKTTASTTNTTSTRKRKLSDDGSETSSKLESQNFELSWVILSSSNLSCAAWGALQKNGSIFTIRSYEVGVLFLPTLISSEKAVKFSPGEPSYNESTDLIHVKFPLPYQLPPPTYNQNKQETKDVPWIWDKTYNEPDIFGFKWERGGVGAGGGE